MDELAVIDFTQSDITTLDFESLKIQLSAKLAEYDSFVYTEENISLVKKDAAYLNKQKKILEDALKAYKKKCMEPYDAVAPKIKELTGMIEEQRQKIKSIDDNAKAQKSEEKEQAVRAYYNKKAVVLGELSDKLYPKLFDKKWINASTSKSKYEEAVQLAVNKAFRDIETIRSWNSPFVEKLISLYVDTMSVDIVETKNNELLSAVKAVGLSKVSVESSAVESIGSSERIEDSFSLRVFANQKQLEQITDFMKIIGVKYEVI